MRYGSVCSGIEAASVAWEPLDWEPAWFAEVEPFPSAVLAHHWPKVENLGDMTRLVRRVMLGEVEAPDVLVGGTPCQAFSVAGMREGMADARGQLTMKFVELADAIDAVRFRAGKPEFIVVWENVPGVLSDKQNAFGCFLGAISGEDRELQPAGKRWTNAGCVYGPTRAVAWRVLDAQYFGVAQRRRRVFVVASARAGFDPAEVLFEREGVRRDSAPRREARKGAAGHAAGRIDCTGDGITGTVSSKWSKGTGGPAEDEHYNLAVVDAVPLLEPGARTGKSTSDPRAGMGVGQDGDPMYTLQAGKQHGVACTVTGDIAHTLNTANNGKGCSEDGTGRGVPTIAFNVHENQRAECTLNDTAGAIKCAGGKPGQGYPAVMTVHGSQDPCVDHHVSFALGRNQGQENAIFGGLAVRRLTPVECERLQGFPDNHTAIPPWHACKCGHTFPEELGKYGCPNCLGENSARLKTVADGPRYKAIGNSMAVPVMQWIGERIAMITTIKEAA